MPQSLPKLFANIFKIKFILGGSLIILVMLFFIPNFLTLWESYRQYNQATHLAEIMQTSLNIFQAVRNLGYERGRANVVLKHTGPLEAMANNRAFVLDRRQEGEKHLDLALASIAKLGLKLDDGLLDRLRESREEVNELRARADQLMTIPGPERDPAFPEKWFAATSKMIMLIRQMLAGLELYLSGQGGLGAPIADLMSTSAALRDEAAPEMSLLASLMGSDNPTSSATYQKIINTRGRTQVLFERLQSAAKLFGSPDVSEKVDAYQELYYARYMPVGRVVLEASLKGGPYPLTPKAFLATGVASIEVLADLMQLIVNKGTKQAQAIVGGARDKFIFQLTMMCCGLVLGGLVLLGIASLIISPLIRLANVTRGIANRKLSKDIPYRQRNDEVGELANAIAVLKANTLTMIEDMEALEQNRKILQQALAEVRVLSGLIPICANCKKIRNDSGYWQQIETYISQHSGAQFSHAICPECVKELYPEFADDVLKKP